MATTLADLRNRAKTESDLVNSNFVSTSEWNTFILYSYLELHSLLVEAYGARYFVQTPSTGYTFTTDGINQQFALPADFSKMLNVSVQVGAPQQWVTLKSFELTDINSISQFNTQIPAAGQTVRLFYIPIPVPITSDSDTLPQPLLQGGWDEYIVIDACIKALMKGKKDVSGFETRKAVFTRRIENEAANRDAGQPSRIQDVMGKRARSMQYALFGTNIYLVGGPTPGWYYGQGDWGPYDGDVTDGFF